MQPSPKSGISPSRTHPYAHSFIRKQCWGVFHNFTRGRNPKTTRFDPSPLEWDGQCLWFHATTGRIMLGTRFAGHTVIRPAWNWEMNVQAEFHLGSVLGVGCASWLEEFVKYYKLNVLKARGPLEEYYLAEIVFEANLKGVSR